MGGPDVLHVPCSGRRGTGRGALRCQVQCLLRRPGRYRCSTRVPGGSDVRAERAYSGNQGKDECNGNDGEPQTPASFLCWRVRVRDRLRLKLRASWLLWPWCVPRLLHRITLLLPRLLRWRRSKRRSKLHPIPQITYCASSAPLITIDDYNDDTAMKVKALDQMAKRRQGEHREQGIDW